MPRQKPLVVVVAREQSYASGELSSAALTLGVELVFASDRCHVLDEMWPSGSIPVVMSEPGAAAEAVAMSLAGRRVSATLGTDETTAIVAESIARRLGVTTSVAGAARRAADKLATRKALTAAGLRQPRFSLVELGRPLEDIWFPAVLKPRCLSASRGVIRVNSRDELSAARGVLEELLTDADIRGRHGHLAESAVFEDFIAGPEIALEGVLSRGELEVICIFDKPRPLDGPAFAESLYVVPTELSPTRRDEVTEATQRAARALGLREGPIHAELRLGPSEPVVIELAARSIGGLCGRTLRLATGHTVAEIVLARLCGIDIALEPPKHAGVSMLSPPSAGVFQGMAGLEQARALEGVVDVEITAPKGQRVAPPPRGSDYLGFVFARGGTRDDVIKTLTAAERLLVADVRALVTDSR